MSSNLFLTREKIDAAEEQIAINQIYLSENPHISENEKKRIMTLINNLKIDIDIAEEEIAKQLVEEDLPEIKDEKICMNPINDFKTQNSSFPPTDTRGFIASSSSYRYNQSDTNAHSTENILINYVPPKRN